MFEFLSSVRFMSCTRFKFTIRSVASPCSMKTTFGISCIISLFLILLLSILFSPQQSQLAATDRQLRYISCLLNFILDKFRINFPSICRNLEKHLSNSLESFGFSGFRIFSVPFRYFSSIFGSILL
jgi:hypothetical protein